VSDLNLSLHGHNTNILIPSDKVEGFTTKLTLWKNELVDGNYERPRRFTQLSMRRKWTSNKIRISDGSPHESAVVRFN
jgi:hypothetical protein